MGRPASDMAGSSSQMKELDPRYRWTSSGHNQAHQYLLEPLVELLAKRGHGAGRVVDIGCGNGALVGYLSERGYEACGFDSSPEGIELATQSRPGLRFIQASVDDLDLTQRLGSGFDVAVALEVIEHLPYPRRLFARAGELLRPGGSLLVSTPYHGYLKNLVLSVTGRWDRHFTVDWDGGHIKFFSRETLRRMAAEGGFAFEEFRGVGRLPFLWRSMLVAFQRDPG